MKKRILSLLLAFLIVASLVPANVLAVDGSGDGDSAPTETPVVTATVAPTDDPALIAEGTPTPTPVPTPEVKQCAGVTGVICEAETHVEGCDSYQAPEVQPTPEVKECAGTAGVVCKAETHKEGCDSYAAPTVTPTPTPEVKQHVEGCILDKNHEGDCQTEAAQPTPTPTPTPEVTPTPTPETTPAPEQHPMVGKIVTLVAEPGMLSAIENPTVSINGNIVGVKAYPERMEIEAVVTVGSVTYYQLKAAEGAWPDYFGTVYEHYWLPSTQVEEVQTNCPVCGTPGCTTEHKKCECGNWDCEIDHTQPENPCQCGCETCTGAEGCECQCGNCGFCVKLVQGSVYGSVGGQAVTVSGMLPEGATLEVAPIANESAVKAELGLDGGFLWDIKVFDANGNEWQPAEGNTVSVRLPISGVPDNSTVNIMHVLDSVDAIEAGMDAGTVEIDTLSHLSGTLRQSFAKEIAACQEITGYTNSVVTECFNELSVSGGYVTVSAGSFSVYTWDNGFKTSTAGSSSSNRIVFNPTSSHSGSNGKVFYVDSYVDTNQSVYVDCGGSRSWREWWISRDGTNWQSNNNNTCVVDAVGDPYNYKSVTSNDIQFKVGTHEVVYAYGSVFWVKCTLYNFWGTEKESAVVKFVVISNRRLTYNANGVTCTLPSESTWKSTYWGSPTSDKVGSDAHVAPSTITIGKPTNIQGNYHFLYWENTDSHNVNAIYYPSDSYSPSMVAGDLTLRAKWAQYYKVTLDAQNGSGDSDGTTAYWYLYNTTKVVNGETVYYWKNQDCTTPLSNYTIEKPTKVGYTFNGYWTGTNGTGTQYVDKNGVCINNLYTAKQENITLYADWVPIPNAVVYTYTGTLPANAPSVPAQKNYDYNSSVTVEAAPTLTGYTFSGWTTSDATVSGGKFTMPNKLVIFSGSWTPNQYDLTFKYNGGQNGETGKSDDVTFKATYGWQDYYGVGGLNPVREGYTFTGWYTAADGGIQVYDSKNICIPGTQYWNNNNEWVYTSGATFYARWTPNSHNVTYSYTGDVPANADPVPVVSGKVDYGTEVTVAANPATVEGYTFSGWTVSGASVTNGKFTMPDNDVTITGSWEVSKHTVTFKDNDGEVLSSTEYPYGTKAEDIQVPDLSAGKKDAEYTYTFTGWDSQIANVTGDATYTATYTKVANSYTITWIFGNGAENKVETLAYGATITKPANPTRTGYNFTGWSPAVPDTMPAEDQTFTAQWEGKTYTLYVYATYGQPGKNSAYTVQYGKDFNNNLSGVITIPTGVRLKGLYTAQNSRGTQVYDADANWLKGTPYWDDAGHWAYEGNLTVYADWETIKYAITYTDTSTGQKTTEKYDPWDTSYVLKSVADRVGYTFFGWKVTKTTGTWSVGGLYAAGSQTWGFSGDVELETVWTPVSYTINYELDGGVLAEGENNPGTYTIESDAFTLINPSKEGYEFAGWTGTELAEATKTVTISAGSMGDRTYTATWTPVEYTITYDLNDGELAAGVTNPETYTIETETFTLNNPTRVGYKFKGWATSENATTGMETETIEKGNTGNKTYYAVWERSLVDLTITATTADTEQSFIFTVRGTRSDGVVFDPIDVVLCSENNFRVTIKDLPVGEYTVTEKDGWSWRENDVGSQKADLRTESKTLSFNFGGVDNLHWLNGYSYNKK